MRLTDNWIDFSVQFLWANIGIVSATSVISGRTPLKVAGGDLAGRC
jgi:hypothetical protein